MKKTILLSLILSTGLAGFAQVRQVVKAEAPLVGTANIYMEAHKGIDEDPVMNFTPSKVFTSNPNRDTEFPVDVQTMMTHYDLQTNKLLGNRMYRYSDGTVGLVATWSQASSLNDRGTGYDYFDGTSWIFNEDHNPLTARVESMRTGWPSYAPYGNNGEIIIAHNGTGLVYYTRSNKGVGSWQGPNYIPNPTNLPGPTSGVELTWPRIVTSGPNHNIIHVISACSDNNDNNTVYLYYSKSTNGTSWVTTTVPSLENWERNLYHADSYVMAANGDNVAILILSIYGHGYVIKSTDNGETWTKIKFWDNPYAQYDWSTDENSLFGGDYDDTDQYGPELGSICIDNDGIVHCAFSGHKYAHQELGTSYTYYYGRTLDGIFYWNETMGTMQGPEWVCPDDQTVIPSDPHNICRMWWPTDATGEYITRNWESANLIGFVTPDDNFSTMEAENMLVTGYFHSCSTSPAICIDENGTIAIAYSTIDASREMSPDNIYRRSAMVSFIGPSHVMGDATGNYSEFPGDCYYEYVKLQDADEFLHSYDEAIYPICPTNTTNMQFWFSYQADDTPGLYSGSGGTQTQPTDNYIWATMVIPDIDITGYTYNINVTANPTNGGNVTGGGSYVHGSTCNLHATPNGGYSFVKWTKNGTQVSTNPNYSFTVTGNASYVAHFQQSTTYYTVTATPSPSDAGTITGAGTYTSGSTCTLQAIPNSGYSFVNWIENGTLVSTNAIYSFTVTNNRNLIAVFDIAPTYYDITATASPTNGGTVTGGGSYASGSTCNIQATPNDGYSFVKWTKDGAQVSTNPSYSFTVTGNASFVAHFQQNTNNYTITVKADPDDGGTVSGEGTYPQGSTITLQAWPNDGYSFVNWTLNETEVSTSSNYSLTVTCNATYVAHFNEIIQEYTITASAAPTNAGEIVGAGTYPAGSTCILSAIPTEGFVFENWSRNGIVVSTDPSYVFEVNGNADFVAHFTQDANHFTITTMADPIEGGTTLGSGTYEVGTTCTIKAIPSDGYEFSKWTLNGSQVSTNESFEFTVTSNAVYVAHFTKVVNHFAITASVEPAEAGSVIGAGIFEEDAICTLIAMPNQTYSFVSWTENGIVVSTDSQYSFVVDRERNLVAVFLQGLFYTISASAGANGTISPEGDVFVEPEEDKTFAIIPNNGCQVRTVLVDGIDLGPIPSYTFRSVNGNHSIHAEFSGLGVDDNVSLDLKIYPNPANDKIHIESPNMKKVSIFNLMGVQIENKEVNDNYTFVNTNGFPQGTYILKVENNDGRIGYLRFVIAK